MTISFNISRFLDPKQFYLAFESQSLSNTVRLMQFNPEQKHYCNPKTAETNQNSSSDSRTILKLFDED